MMQPDLKEALRYCGVHTADADSLQHMKQLADHLQPILSPKHVWRCFTLTHGIEGVLLNECALMLTGKTAARMLQTCDRAALMVCTLGVTFDTALRRTQTTDMAEALLMNGLGSAWVEAVCDDTQREIAEALPDYYLTDRFSPGYGDLPLTLQRELLNAVNAAKMTGVTLTDSSLMLPQKSVTAIVGISRTPQQARIRGCRYCALSSTCTMCKGGHTCAV